MALYWQNGQPADINDPKVQEALARVGTTGRGSDVYINANPPTATSSVGPISGSSNGGFQPVPGSDIYVQQAISASNEKINELNAQLSRDLAAINNAATMERLRVDAQLQRELQSQRITSEQYMQQRRLAQQESEFARQLALNQLIADHDYEINLARNEIAKYAEIRQERELQARLAANPADWVAYEFYKRSLGETGVPTARATTAAGGTLAGGTYPEAPPSYTDETLQELAEGLQNPVGAPYNPNLRGTGVFGSTIQNPNSLSRQEARGLSPTEMAMLTGLLKGGIEIGGRRVAIDPADYFQQVEESWIPTLQGGISNWSQQLYT